MKDYCHCCKALVPIVTIHLEDCTEFRCQVCQVCLYRSFKEDEEHEKTLRTRGITTRYMQRLPHPHAGGG